MDKADLDYRVKQIEALPEHEREEAALELLDEVMDYVGGGLDEMTEDLRRMTEETRRMTDVTDLSTAFITPAYHPKPNKDQ